MAGMAVLFKTDGIVTAADTDVVSDMLDSIAHRGNTNRSVEVFHELVAGVGRRKGENKDSPDNWAYCRSGELAVAFTGRIYNKPELLGMVKENRQEANMGTAALILRLYQQDATSFFRHINGAFSIVIYDKPAGEVKLVRDQFGILPMFIYKTGIHLVACSEIKGILKFPGYRRALNRKGLDHLLHFPGIIPPETMFLDIYEVPAGQMAVYKEGDVSFRAYWDMEYPEVTGSYDRRNTSELEEHALAILRDAVKSRMSDAGQQGVYLSGGLDSSLLACLSKESMESGIQTFSIAETAGGNDLYYQHLLRDYLGAHHHQLDFTLDLNNLYHQLKEVICDIERPQKDITAIFRKQLARFTRSHGIEAVISGDGADELFGGHIGYVLDSAGNRSMSDGKTYLERLLEEQLHNKIWGDPHFIYERPLSEFADLRKAFYQHSNTDTDAIPNCLDNVLLNTDNIRNRHVFNQRSYVDIKIRLGGHLLTSHCDRVNYSEGLETRLPFLDIRLAEFVRGLPPEVKNSYLGEKTFLRKVARKVVPAAIVDRKKFEVTKGRSAMALGNTEWFNDLLSYDYIKQRGIFNPALVEQLKKRLLSNEVDVGSAYEDNLLLLILSCNIFLEEFKIN
ncbi:hypothetical protein HGH92_29560 [Chitinophaga varians]|uniref:asparagine synthase (glutamine-hydrolyzing) n=1 Tax=Chitinophaga varians TaxID=2202339 RepID=A0A847S5Y8_9BACT|nr:asparagine synthase-related protein [Chitinophaga varians]NLR68488.1 hypothetical protein [Chitinophaga varians]